jgi:FAD/FMN-containing dehydrogenase
MNMMNRGDGSARPTGFIEAARAIAGENRVLTAPDALTPYISEMRGLQKGHAEAVLIPRSTGEVAAFMALAHAHKVRVVVQGGNTGLVGGGLPFGGVVMSLAKLNTIRAVDAVNATMLVEAGVILKDVQEAASQVDRLFPLSLGSEGSCTIGGNIASNAGGTAVLRYGNMRDLVLGLEVVLPDGRILNALSGLRKDNAGYDLKHLFIGSEGTLGIVTAAIIKLFPRPKSRLAAFVGTKSPAEVVSLFDRLRAKAGERLTTFEILPRFGLEIVLKHAPGVRDPLEHPHPFYAFIELTAPEADAPLMETLMPALEAALEEGEIADAALATSEAQAYDFWRIREQLAECQKFEGGSIKHDVSVPISRVADFMVAASAACEAALPGIRVCGFGHIGDGNIHFNLSQPVGMEKAAFLAEWHRFNTLVHDLVAERGGSIAAEHGVGLFKRDELPLYKDAVALDVMKTLKRALDPGKVIAMGEDEPVFTPGG